MPAASGHTVSATYLSSTQPLPLVTSISTSTKNLSVEFPSKPRERQWSWLAVEDFVQQGSIFLLQETDNNFLLTRRSLGQSEDEDGNGERIAVPLRAGYVPY